VSATSAPGTYVPPLAGPVIASVGRASTMTVTWSVAITPRMSCTVAVMRCVPEVRCETLIAPPVPSPLSNSSVHAIDVGQVPSSGSAAVATKPMAAPGAYGPLLTGS
jgi:hypothetical protein